MTPRDKLIQYSTRAQMRVKRLRLIYFPHYHGDFHATSNELEPPCYTARARRSHYVAYCRVKSINVGKIHTTVDGCMEICV